MYATIIIIYEYNLRAYPLHGEKEQSSYNGGTRPCAYLHYCEEVFTVYKKQLQTSVRGKRFRSLQ